MKPSTIQWHLARDNQEKLAKFCESNKVRSEQELYTYNDGEHDYYEVTYHFDNGGHIKAELLHGDTKSYTTADHFQVLQFGFGD